jgi:hypothetical protein
MDSNPFVGNYNFSHVAVAVDRERVLFVAFEFDQLMSPLHVEPSSNKELNI